MLDRKQIGKVFPAHSAEVEKGRLRFFAKAIGETSPVYTDEAAARASGYHSLPVPPTFLFSLMIDPSDPLAWFHEVGIDIPSLLHGEQSFTYHQPVCAGDVVTFVSRVADIYDKKNGTLEFLVRETRVTNQTGQHVADLRSVFVQRNQA